MSKQLSDLDTLYKDGEEADRAIFAEMRSNILLVNGDHYTKRQSQFLTRLRDSIATTNSTQDSRIRITMNQTQVVTNTYVNNIVTYVPNVAVLPKIEKDLASQKAAELSQSVWQDLKDREHINDLFEKLTHDFVEIGEAHCQIRWDANAGQLIGYKQETDDFGNPVFQKNADGSLLYDVNGVPIPVGSKEGVFNGGIKYERLLAPNIIRNANAKSLQESNFLCHRKMVSVQTLKKMIGNDTEKLKYVEESQDKTFLVFDGSRGVYPTTKGMCMVREFYFRPGIDYPNGYYMFVTDKGVLWEGELPFGIFPIMSVGFKHVATTPRAHSIVKVIRPMQAELNRAVSKMAEHQVTLGDDKIIYPTGTKLAEGGKQPGIRALTASSAVPPTIIQGRSGAQYLDYFDRMSAKIYELANITEEMAMKDLSQIDVNAQLFASLRQKKKYSIYTNKLESFFAEICKTSLTFANKTYNDTHLVPAIGMCEYINIPEFKKKNLVEVQIKTEPQLDDVETKMGKHLGIQQILQYVGQNIEQEDLALLIRNMPYVNKEQIFESKLLNYDGTTNDILAMDRGEQVMVNFYDDHQYYINKFTLRKRKPDYKFLPANVKAMYDSVIAQHEQFEVERLRQMQLAQSQIIPTTGYMVKLDMYMSKPSANGESMETKRAEAPYDAVKWLLDKIQQQGVSMDGFESMDPSAQQQIAQQFNQPAQYQQPESQGMPL